ncbi:MAG: hypothetical protein J7K61_01015 [Thermoplasmata archaeon]|nr:hypothetical protein [Thermoplasmata archaeon]
MAYSIFEVKRENEAVIEEIKKDDVVGRQSIVTRDAKSLEMDGNVIYLKIEGSKEAIERAKKMLEGKAKLLEGEETEKINKKIVEDEEAANEGMGFIFG